jgi:glycosyltransferase involved in cell wall biosynthesis
MEQEGITYEVSSFIDQKAWKILYQPGHLFQKFTALFRGYVRRINDILRLSRFDVVFIHREASPFGLPVFEWLITKVFKKYTVYDFDDAIWVPNASETNSGLTMLFKRFKNAEDTCRWASVVSVGNSYLAEFASKLNQRVVINPTTIDTDEHHNTLTDHGNARFVIGWTGSHSTLKYLNEIYPILERLERKYDFEFHVICDIAPKSDLKCIRFVKWNKESEIDDLLKFNVGIMPLPDDIWSKGKCGFKALQYMALGIPAVVSNVGVNAEIVDHGKNGYICQTSEEWYTYLEKMLSDPKLVMDLSLHTRDKIVENYSVKSNSRNFLSLLKKN